MGGWIAVRQVPVDGISQDDYHFKNNRDGNHVSPKMEKFFAEQVRRSEQKTDSTQQKQQQGDTVASSGDEQPKKIPKGVVLGKDGKP